MWESKVDESECYCVEPDERGFGFEYTDGCTEENIEHSLEMINDPIVRDETAEYVLDQFCP